MPIKMDSKDRNTSTQAPGSVRPKSQMQRSSSLTNLKQFKTKFSGLKDVSYSVMISTLLACSLYFSVAFFFLSMPLILYSLSQPLVFRFFCFLSTTAKLFT